MTSRRSGKAQRQNSKLGQKEAKSHWKVGSWLGTNVKAKAVCGQGKRNGTAEESKSQTLEGFTKECIQKNPLKMINWKMCPESDMINLEIEFEKDDWVSSVMAGRMLMVTQARRNEGLTQGHIREDGDWWWTWERLETRMPQRLWLISGKAGKCK